jgi:PKD repeat protein
MMKKNFNLILKRLFLGLFIATSVLSPTYGQFSVSLAGTDNFDFSATYGPLVSSNTANQVARAAHIYNPTVGMPAGVFGSGAILNGLDFKRAGANVAALAGTTTLKIYVANTTDTTFGTRSPLWADLISTATLVYDGDPAAIVGTSIGWKTFPFSTNVTYTGGMLMVLAEYTQTTAQATGLYWVYDNAGPVGTNGRNNYFANTSKYTNTTTTLPDALSTSQTRKPQMQLKFNLPACSGTPSAGTVSASGTCGGSATFTAVGATAAGSLVYQWEQSTIGGTSWANAVGGSGANTTTYTTPAVTVATQYRLKVTCTPTSTLATSAPVTVSPQTFATLPYQTSFETAWQTRCAPGTFSGDAPDAFWAARPGSGNTSWRIDNTAVTTSGWGSVNGAYSPAFSAGARSARFHSYNAPAATRGSLDFYVNLSPAGNKQISFDHINPTGTDSLLVSLSTDGGTTFTLLGSKGISTAWTAVRYTTTSVAPNAVVRFEGVADFGNDDIGIDNLAVTLNCSGRPTAGTVAASSVCSGSSAVLSAIGTTVGAGISYQWQSSPTGVTYTDIVGATNLTYTTPALLANAQYRMIATCAATAQSDTTLRAPVTVTFPTYATVPYAESFESWSTGCTRDTFTLDRPTSSWVNTPAQGNASWRRNDQGASAGWTSTTAYLYSPVSTLGASSARFHSGNVTRGTKATLDLYVNMSNAGSKEVSFDYINTSGSDSLRVFLSTDGGTSFTQLDSTLKVASAWRNQKYTLTTTSATAVVRLEATADFGSTDIGIDKFSVSLPCAGTPVAGVIGGRSFVCPGGQSEMSVTGQSVASGLTYQWQRKTGATYTNIAGETALAFKTPALYSTAQYRLAVTCANGGATTNTDSFVVNVAVPQYQALPYVQSFESWQTACAVDTFRNETPAPGWYNSPTSGNNSWRRSDEGLLGGWGLTTSGGYTPAATRGQYAARFHSYFALAALEGKLEAFMNFSGNSTKVIQLDYINKTGTDKLLLEFSPDGGLNFETFDTLKTVANWTTYTYSDVINLPNSVLRFRAISDYGDDDIYIDNVRAFVLPVDGRAVSSSALPICKTGSRTLSVVNDTLPAGIRRIWQSSADSLAWVDIAGATGTTYVASPTATTFYRAKHILPDSIFISASSAVKVVVETGYAAAFTAANTIGGTFAFNNTSTGAATQFWNFGNTPATTSTAVSPSVTYLTNGSYTVKLLITTASGCKDSTTTTVNVTRVNNRELAEELGVKISPNPFSDAFSIQFNGANAVLSAGDKIMITNVLGQVVYSTNISGTTLNVETANWAEGVYSVTATVAGKTVHLSQIVKVKQ